MILANAYKTGLANGCSNYGQCDIYAIGYAHLYVLGRHVAAQKGYCVIYGSAHTQHSRLADQSISNAHTGHSVIHARAVARLRYCP